MNCLIADDHWIVRKGMISIMENHFSDLHFDQASRISEIFSMLEKKNCSLLLLDFFYTDGVLKKSISEIKSISNDAKIIVMSSSITYFDYLEIKDHVNAILSKQSSQAAIINCIQKVLFEDTSYINNYHQLFFDKVDLLSSRELEIVKLIINGYGNKEMVNKLDLKENTISTLRKRAFDKLEIENNVELINLFMQSVL
jgi:DNA-binding NarL/FixJ family response regulator